MKKKEEEKKEKIIHQNFANKNQDVRSKISGETFHERKINIKKRRLWKRNSYQRLE